MTTAGWATIIVINTNVTSGGDTNAQYMRAAINWNTSYPTFVLRYLDSTHGFYVVTLPYTAELHWEYFENAADTSGTQIGTTRDIKPGQDFVDGDIIGVTITGKGDNTIVRVWLNPTNPTPAAVDGWDTAEDTAITTWTDNPVVAADDGTKVGFRVIQNAANDNSFDDFYAGDPP